MTSPVTSVVVPSYRSAQTIRACLTSVLGQDFAFPYEVILVDSSDDGTADIVRSEFPSVRLFALGEQTEAPLARNHGLSAARGDILACIDSDCVAPGDWLRRLCAVLEQGYDGVGGAIANGNPDSPVSWAGYLCEFGEFLPGGRLRRADYMTPGNVAYRRRVLLSAGGFPAGWFPLEDQVLGRALRDRNARLCVDPSIVVAHTHRTDRRAFLDHQREFGKCNARALRRLTLPGTFLARRRWRASLALPGLVTLKLMRTLYASRRVERGLWWRRPEVAWLCWLGTWSWGRGFVEAANGDVARPSPPVGERLPAVPLPSAVGVSVVVATLDRPDLLRLCLRGLTAQDSTRAIEIVVVDNNPSSGLTPPVLAEFPSVKLVAEARQGLSYARNTGILASRGEIVVTTDDDVSLPPDWLEKLVAPLARPEVMIVTGATRPVALETPSERAFEARGGLGPGLRLPEVGRSWFDSFRFRAAPTWLLGTTANAAFRRRLFAHPDIGLFDEALGPGTPAGAAEETYLFYRALKAGMLLCHEPGAISRHQHRRTMPDLRRQVYDYSRGQVAYHLTTLVRDHDPRALVQLVLGAPFDLLRRLVEHSLIARSYPVGLILVEALGFLIGPFGFLRSRSRARRLGRRGHLPACESLHPPIAARHSPEVETCREDDARPE